MIGWVLLVFVCFIISFQPLYLLERAPRYVYMAAKSFGCKPCEVVRWVDRMNRFEDILVAMRLICRQAKTSIFMCSTLDRSCLDIWLANVGNIWLQKLEHISYALHFVNRAYQDPGQYDTIHIYTYDISRQRRMHDDPVLLYILHVLFRYPFNILKL